ncbi:MAG: DUF2142 domain-containing protein [Anaerolineae bacterium]|nr:DUF2142 domain-containing protein [Anaerolineae bacterium]
MITRRLPLLILAVYVALAVIYSLVTPMFEAPDENYHYAFIQRLAQSWELPVQNPDVITAWYQEGSQPPLYYLLASVIVKVVNPAYEEYPLEQNPHAKIGVGLATDNHNFFVHTHQENFPWTGHVLALRLVRFASILLGAVTVWAVYRGATLINPHPNPSPAGGRRAIEDSPSSRLRERGLGGEGFPLLAMCFVAFNPMFLFMTGSVNNDNMVTMLSALAMWLMLLILMRGWTWQRVGLLSAVIALAALSKLSGLTLYAVAGALIGMEWLRRRITLRQAILSIGALIAGFVIIAGWWYLRNWQLYGDVTGLNTMIAIIAPRQTPYTLITMLEEMQGLRISFWALFGWFNVIGPDWFLLAMDALIGIALIGGVWLVARRIQDRDYALLYPLGLLAFHFAVTFVSLINWTRLTPGTQGRLLFPALTAIAVLAAVGWQQLGRLRIAPIAVMGVVALASPILTIAPAYAPPPPSDAYLPSTASKVAIHNVKVRFGTLLFFAYDITPQIIQPGEKLRIRLHYIWPPDYSRTRNLSLYLTALDRFGNSIGKIDSYPGGGNLPTSQFDTHKSYVDTYWMDISSDAQAPTQIRIEFGWWDYETKERIPATDGDGKPIESVILRGGALISPEQPTPAITQTAVFSGALRLNGYGLDHADGKYRQGEPIRVDLNWEALTQVYEDFTVFVHLRDANDQTVAYGDSPPLDGFFPTTAWVPQYRFNDPHTLATTDLPAGTYHLVIGLYRPADLSRLPVDSGGDSVILSTPITIE